MNVRLTVSFKCLVQYLSYLSDTFMSCSNLVAGKVSLPNCYLAPLFS